MVICSICLLFICNQMRDPVRSRRNRNFSYGIMVMEFIAASPGLTFFVISGLDRCWRQCEVSRCQGKTGCLALAWSTLGCLTDARGKFGCLTDARGKLRCLANAGGEFECYQYFQCFKSFQCFLCFIIIIHPIFAGLHLSLLQCFFGLWTPFSSTTLGNPSCRCS